MEKIRDGHCTFNGTPVDGSPKSEPWYVLESKDWTDSQRADISKLVAAIREAMTSGINMYPGR